MEKRRQKRRTQKEIRNQRKMGNLTRSRRMLQRKTLQQTRQRRAPNEPEVQVKKHDEVAKEMVMVLSTSVHQARRKVPTTTRTAAMPNKLFLIHIW